MAKQPAPTVRLTKLSKLILTMLIVAGIFFGVKKAAPYFIAVSTETKTVPQDTYDIMPGETKDNTSPPAHTAPTIEPTDKQPLAEIEEKVSEKTPVTKKSVMPKKLSPVTQKMEKKTFVSPRAKGALDLEDDHNREKITPSKGALDLEDDHKKKKK